jgi:peptide/nickel transport system substrate-binding protein
MMVSILVACAGRPTTTPPTTPTEALAEAALEIPPTTVQQEAPTADPDEALSEGGTLTRAMTSEPAQIDPQGTPSSGLSLVMPYIYDTLVARHIDNSIHPQLAESWEVSADGLIVTIHLKEGITFHDGAPLNADAVVFTFERFKEVGVRSPIYGGVMQISAIEAADDLTVNFTFAEPAANFWSTITMPYAGIISPDSARRFDESGEGYIVGSGPFMLGDWETGQAIILERNPEYAWGPPLFDNQGQPHLDEFVYKVIPDASTQLSALIGGEVDVMFINEPSHVMRLEAEDSIRTEEVLLSSLVYLGFNCQKPPFDEILVRQALAHAIDKKQIVDLALAGIGREAFAPLPPTLLGFDPSLEAHALKHDPDESGRLLAEAGFELTDEGTWMRSGEPLRALLLTSTRAPNENIATLIQSQLGEVGVQVEIQQLDSRAVMQATGEGAFDLLLWRYDWNDPDALQIFLSSDRIGRTNRVAYSNTAVDELLEAGAHELHEQKRVEIYLQAQQIILQEAPWQPLYNPVNILAMRDRVQGASTGSMGRLLLNDIRVLEE